MKKLSVKSVEWFKHFPVGIAILCIGLFYFIYLPVNYDFDGTVFSHYLRHGLVKGDLSAVHQPHHPLYIPVNYFLYKGLNILTGYNVLEYFHLQLFSLIFGMLTLWFSYKIIRQITDNRFYHFAGVFLIALSNGIWYYSVEAEVHMAGLCFVTAGIYYLFFKQKPGYPGKTGDMAAAALCFALAAGFHITNGLILSSAFIVFLIEKRTFKAILRFFTFCVLFLALELSIFALLTKMNILTYFKDQLVGNDVLAGYKISYWNGFSFEAAWEFIRACANGILYPMSGVTSTIAGILFLAAIAFIIYIIFTSFKYKKLYLTLLAWMLPYAVFFFFWDRANFEFKLNIILPFMILLTGIAAEFSAVVKRKKLFSWVVVGVICIIGCSNFYFYMRPAGSIENNRDYKVAEAIGGKTSPGDVIVIMGCGPEHAIYNKIYIPYFALRQVFILDWVVGKGYSLDQVADRVSGETAKDTNGGYYFFSDALQQGEALTRFLENHKFTAPGYFEFLKKIKWGDKIALPDGYYLRPVLSEENSWKNRRY
jgi:hypothetical protein